MPDLTCINFYYTIDLAEIDLDMEQIEETTDIVEKEGKKSIFRPFHV